MTDPNCETCSGTGRIVASVHPEQCPICSNVAASGSAVGPTRDELALTVKQTIRDAVVVWPERDGDDRLFVDELATGLADAILARWPSAGHAEPEDEDPALEAALMAWGKRRKAELDAIEAERDELRDKVQQLETRLRAPREYRPPEVYGSSAAAPSS